MSCRRKQLVTVILLLASLIFIVKTEAANTSTKEKLRWAPCRSNPAFQCTDIHVPLNYDAPTATIKVHVVIRPANIKAKRKQLLFVNFGGPWASSADLFRWAPYLNPSILNHFTLVAVDPRGTGWNKIQCRTDVNKEILDINLNGPDAAQKLITLRREKSKICKTQYKHEILPYVGTRNTARDMDAVRKALNVAKINYLGYSYGSKLGAVYLTLYPSHVRAMVIDGNMSPYNDFQQLARDDARAVSQTLARFFKQCAKTKSCPLYPAPEKQYLKALKKIKTNTVHAGKNVISEAIFTKMVIESLTFTGGKGTTKLFPTSLWGNLAKFIQAINTNNDEAVIKSLYKVIPKKILASKRIKGDSIFAAVICMDYAHHPSSAEAITLAKTLKKQYPLIGGANGAYFATLCAGWPQPAKPLQVTHFTQHDPILIIGNQSDPETPLVWSHELNHAIKNSHLLIWSGAGHTAYMNNEPPAHCVENYVNRYLLTLKLPKSGTVCHAFHNPFREA